MSRLSYGRVTPEMVDSIRKLVGENNVITGDSAAAYSRDESPGGESALPDAVVRPGNTSEVAEIMRLANENTVPVTPRGSGTGLSGGAVPVHGGIVLSTERMNRILELDGDNFTATVEPGVVLSDLYEAVEGRGLYYPLYPGEIAATIGGNVATNAGGMRAVKYGVTRDFVLGLDAVLPTGEAIETGGKYIKCSTAYDLTQLIVGSEGTLAVITRIILRLMPPPGRRNVLLVPFSSLGDAMNAVPEILKQRVLPVGIEFLEKDVVALTEKFTGMEIPLHGYEASLMIIVEADNEEESLSLSSRVAEICTAQGATNVFVTNGNDARRLLQFREKAWPAITHAGRAEMADVVVPRSQVSEFVRNVRLASDRLGVKVYMVGHAGDGNVHLGIMWPDTEDAHDRVGQLFHRVYEIGTSMGGTISGEHGIGVAKREYVGIALSHEKVDLMRRVKRAFDPNNIMNPGKIFGP